MCRALPMHTIHFQRAQQGLIRGYVCALVKPAIKTDIIFIYVIVRRDLLRRPARSTSHDCGWWKKPQLHAQRNLKQCVAWLSRIDFHLWSESDSPAPVRYRRLAAAPGGALRAERSYRRHHQTRRGNEKVTHANSARVGSLLIPRKRIQIEQL